jgi:plasmid stability protein
VAYLLIENMDLELAREVSRRAHLHGRSPAAELETLLTVGLAGQETKLERRRLRKPLSPQRRILKLKRRRSVVTW